MQDTVRARALEDLYETCLMLKGPRHHEAEMEIIKRVTEIQQLTGKTVVQATIKEVAPVRPEISMIGSALASTTQSKVFPIAFACGIFAPVIIPLIIIFSN